MSRTCFLIILLVILNTQHGSSQDNPAITKIRIDFQKWQSIIAKELPTADQFFKYVGGEEQQFHTWSTHILENDSLSLSEAVSILTNKELGTLVSVDNPSSSGDWSITADNYYNKAGKLYFIFWRMNTFYAEIALTVEKRLYFNNAGRLLREIKSVYKMNTQEKVDLPFMDKPVDYKLNLSDLEVYKYWRQKK